MPVSRARKAFEPKIKPYWQSDCGRAVMYVGDCRKVLPLLEPEQFHAVVTDPPYGLEFMGREWDAPWKKCGTIETVSEGTDKSHPFRDGTNRMRYGLSDPQGYQAWFLECAGGMMHVAKPGAHLLSFGGTRMWHRMVCAIEDAGFDIRDTIMWLYGSGYPKSHNVSKAIDKAAGVTPRKISKEEYAATKGEFGASVGTVDKSRIDDGTVYGIGHTGDFTSGESVTEQAKEWKGWGTALKPAVEPIILARKPMGGPVAQCVLANGAGGLNIDGCRVGENGLGRWPANVVCDGNTGMGEAARFFYTAKADDSDRPHGNGAAEHPTVKPLDLMQYLVRLVCAKGGTVLDPFMGSGSTGVAALYEGLWFVGVEENQEYADIAVGRLRLALEWAPAGVQLMTGKRVEPVKDIPPPPKRLRG